MLCADADVGSMTLYDAHSLLMTTLHWCHIRQDAFSCLYSSTSYSVWTLKDQVRVNYTLPSRFMCSNCVISMLRCISRQTQVILRASYHNRYANFYAFRHSRVQARSNPGTGDRGGRCAAYIVSRQSLYLLDPPSAHIPSSEKPGIELPTDCLRGSRLNHRLDGPVGVNKYATCCDDVQWSSKVCIQNQSLLSRTVRVR